MRAEYERRYKRYENAPQPRITAVQVQVDLVPERGDMRVRGPLRAAQQDAACRSTPCISGSTAT